MELRDFVRLFIRRRQLIVSMVIGALILGFFVYRFQSQWYAGSVLLSVTRQGAEATSEYRYDEFYRLQADERMAETLARYLETEIGRRDTARRALLSGVSEREFIGSRVKALRLSSNLVQISYRASTPIEANRLAAAFLETGEQYMTTLNAQADTRNWFTLSSSEALVRDGRFGAPFALSIAFAAGVFVAFWSVLGLWYWHGKPIADGPSSNRERVSPQS